MGFSGFLEDPVELVGVEAGGKGLFRNTAAGLAPGSNATVGVSGYKPCFYRTTTAICRIPCLVPLV